MANESSRILVIEPDASLRGTLERTLRARGGAVVSCAPEAALETLRHFRPGLVLVAADSLGGALPGALAELSPAPTVVALVNEGPAAALPGATGTVAHPLTASRLDAAIESALGVGKGGTVRPREG